MMMMMMMMMMKLVAEISISAHLYGGAQLGEGRCQSLISTGLSIRDGGRSVLSVIESAAPNESCLSILTRKFG